jgi:hypothetical protein
VDPYAREHVMVRAAVECLRHYETLPDGGLEALQTACARRPELQGPTRSLLDAYNAHRAAAPREGTGT